MKRFWIVPVALMLAGCGDQLSAYQKREQLARCLYDAETGYPDATWLRGGARQNYVWLCMSAHGYALDHGQKACAGNTSPAAEAVLYAQCYDARAKLASLFYRLEGTLRR